MQRARWSPNRKGSPPALKKQLLYIHTWVLCLSYIRHDKHVFLRAQVPKHKVFAQNQMSNSYCRTPGTSLGYFGCFGPVGRNTTPGFRRLAMIQSAGARNAVLQKKISYLLILRGLEVSGNWVADFFQYLSSHMLHYVLLQFWQTTHKKLRTPTDHGELELHLRDSSILRWEILRDTLLVSCSYIP